MVTPDDGAESAAADGARTPTADGHDLYDITDWEVRTPLDRVAVGLYRVLHVTGRVLVVLLALVILGVFVVLGGLGVITEEPVIGVLAVLSVLPALALAAYVWHADATTGEPLRLLVATYLLGILFAGFAAVLNSVGEPLLAWIPVVGMPLFFYLIVAPIEETVKLLAVRLHAYRSETFNTVLDGAVYGAMAGLGFATIENALYISRGYLQAADGSPEGALLGAATGTAAVRALAGPGHVIYSAIAGYYLGLAKFNPHNRGPIVVKGLLIAALIHATYNTLSGVVTGILSNVAGVGIGVALLAFIIVYDGIFGYYLYRKIRRYNDAVAGTGRDASATDSA